MGATPVTALQEVANVRLMLQQQQHPGAMVPVTICRQVIDCSIQQTKLISSRDNGPGIDTGDILCEGYLTRAALLPPATPQSNPWDWLAADQAWQPPGVRATFQPLPVPPATEPPRPTAVQVPAEGVCWLGDLSLLQTPGVLPLSPRAVFAGASLLMIGQAYGPGGIGLQVQPELGEAISFALKPNRVLVLESGDSLNLIAERYGTTVQTLRAVNPDLAQQGPITTAAGDTLNVLAARHGTTVDFLRKLNPSLLRAEGHTTAAGDTLKQLAIDYDTTVDWLRLYNPDYDRWPRSDPLPVGVLLEVPAIRPSDELDVGQVLQVPLIRPGTLLNAGGWIYLPPLRGVSAADDLWDVDLTPDPPPVTP
jgi:LysM repeat protein